MATLAKCPSCNHDVSRDAKTCPHCGQPLSFRNPYRGVVGVAIALILGSAILSTKREQPPSNASNGSAELPCKSDWSKCADNSEMANSNGWYWSRAQVKCKHAADEHARYGTPKWPWLYFSTFKPGTDYVTSGIALLIEPDAQFQNGFGAMVHSKVICKYDLKSERVLDMAILER